ncbi:unnamed protein product [Nippostrongylus brasiliensis]|uniref:DUF3972 domain-containing protein n=1 Tax=Nippostrongylus brasiliensis TaxID=27835 RepID=A0A0N4YKR4_NIPBR|nr:unnamed protein product [Nippostrongylus brasiliensis]
MLTRSAASVKDGNTSDRPEVSGPVAELSEDLLKAMDEVTRATSVPRCVKKALGIISRQLAKILEEKDRTIEELRSENERLRQTIASYEVTQTLLEPVATGREGNFSPDKEGR